MKTIVSIIQRYGLKRGDTMMTAYGDPIPNSLVVDEDTTLTIHSDRPWTQAEGSPCMAPVHMARMTSLLGADEVHTVFVDDKPLTNHRSVDGAVRAAIGHMSSCMERTGGLPLDDEDVRLVRAVLMDERRLDLQVRAGLIDAVPGMTPERITLLAMRISREYRIGTNALLD